MPRIRDRLVDWSRDELAELVERMVHREPDLSPLLDTPPPGRTCVANGDDIATQVDLEFRAAARGDWRTSLALARQLRDLTELGIAHAERGESSNAITVLATVAAGICAHYDEIHDDESEVARVIDDCVAGLERSVVAAEPGAREEAFRALAAAMVWGPSYGVGERAVDVIERLATPAEREAAVSVVESGLAQESNEWARKRLGRLLLQLRGTDVSEAGVLELLRSTGNRDELVRRLLELHRLDEAAATLMDAPWVELPELADAFSEHGYRERARAVLEAILVERREQGCWLAMQWLHRLAVARGRATDQRRWSVELFWEGPSVDRWKLVREATREAERRQIRGQLRKDGRYHLLVRILLSEGPHKAVEARNLLRLADPNHADTVRLGACVAEALADRKPRDAARLWRAEADRLCHHGHPDTYKEAVDLIMKGRTTLVAAGHPRLAAEYLDAFKASHKARRTLQSLLANRIADE